MPVAATALSLLCLVRSRHVTTALRGPSLARRFKGQDQIIEEIKAKEVILVHLCLPPCGYRNHTRVARAKTTLFGPAARDPHENLLSFVAAVQQHYVAMVNSGLIQENCRYTIDPVTGKKYVYLVCVCFACALSTTW